MDNLVKQRVVGAVVLVALAVIFIPILLEGPEEETGPRSLDLPPPLEEMRESRTGPEEPVLVVPPDPVTTVVIGENGTADPTSAPAAEPEVPTATEAPSTPAVEPEPVPTPAPAPEPASTPAPDAVPAPPSAPAAPAPAAGGWVAQVGAFGQEANALALRDRLRQAGHAAFVERVMVDARPVYRVRVGPFTERAAAEARLADLARDSGLQVRVMPHP